MKGSVSFRSVALYALAWSATIHQDESPVKHGLNNVTFQVERRQRCKQQTDVTESKTCRGKDVSRTSQM